MNESCYFPKKQPTFYQFLLYFLFINKILPLIIWKTSATMTAKLSVFVNCVQSIINLLLYNLHDCTFKKPKPRLIKHTDLSSTTYIESFDT